VTGGWAAGATHLRVEQEPSYGTVGNCPAVSCASRCALSPFSCEEFSFGTNLPPFGGPPGLASGVAALPLVVFVAALVVFAAPLEAALMTVAPTAPPAIDPATSAARRPRFMVFI
jgi:hypothetical protein